MSEKAMTWLQFLKELDDVRSKVRGLNHIMADVDWNASYVQNLLFVLNEHQVTPRMVPVEPDPEERVITRKVMMAGREVNVNNGPEDQIKVTPIPRAKDNTVNKTLNLVETDKNGKALVDQPKKDDSVAWAEGDS